MADVDSGRFAQGRHAGVIVPLFSIPSRRSWGIGEIPDLPHLAAWLSSAGFDFVQLLPINEMERGQNSPYSALSAMALDPLYIAIEDLPDFAAAGGLAALGPAMSAAIDEARRAAGVQYSTIREAKARALRLAFSAFEDARGRDASVRADAFGAFVEREHWWLADYALFRALDEERQGRYWRDWEEQLRDRHPVALAAARERLAPDVRYFQYCQWIADTQWRRARARCGTVGLFGDFPFVVNGHSADVWARQHEFYLDASVGVPVADGAAEEQDWGLPAYRWEVAAANGYQWLADRTRRSADLFDGFRVDHLVGFYRTYIRDRQKRGFFSPADEPTQIAQGEALMSLFRGHGTRILAEDLGVVPDFVRESQARMRVPGLKVLRWERYWNTDGQPFRDPAEYPADSVAISGTHDTETLADWWDGAADQERAAAAAIPWLAQAGLRGGEPFDAATRDALLGTLFHAGSDFVLMPLQDVFGWRERVNTPIVSDDNWTWRLPYAVESLIAEPEAIERARFVHGLAGASGRLTSKPA